MESESSTATRMATTTTTGTTVMDGHERPERCQDVELCSFCRARPAVVRVPLPSLKKRHKRIPTAFCLLHYYTTSAVRVKNHSINAVGGGAAAAAAAGAPSESKQASRPSSTDSAAAVATTTVINHKALEEQLPAQQELFAEAFVQLRQELQEIAMQQFTAHGHDPLAILHDLHHRHPSSSATRTTAAAAATSKKRSFLKDPPMKQQQKRNKIMDQSGGFLQKSGPVPERLQKLQQTTTTKAALQQQPRRPDPTQRRKSSRKSVWNVLLDDDGKGININTATKTNNNANNTINVDWTMGVDKVCTCGSTQVQTIASNTSHRNQDMAKAETWGNKDRGGDIITRYQCHTCGKMWNEEE